jgi:hypothetical protein
MIVITLSALSSWGQSIADQLAIAHCSFRLFAGPSEVTVLDQIITQRAVSKSSEGLKTFGTAYHIEITYKGEALNLQGATVEFLDSTKRPLHTIALDGTRFMNVTLQGSRSLPKTHYIAISLEGIPLRLLDEVVSIRIRE